MTETNCLITCPFKYQTIQNKIPTTILVLSSQNIIKTQRSTSVNFPFVCSEIPDSTYHNGDKIKSRAICFCILKGTT